MALRARRAGPCRAQQEGLYRLRESTQESVTTHSWTFSYPSPYQDVTYTMSAWVEGDSKFMAIKPMAWPKMDEPMYVDVEVAKAMVDMLRSAIQHIENESESQK